MTIQDVINMAKYSELQQLNVKDDNDAIISYINLGIIELYKRFQLSTSEVIITLGQDGDVTNPYTRVTDTEYIMPSDFMVLISGYEENGTEITINDETSIYSIYTIAWNRIQVPALGDDSTAISIIYQPKPTLFTIGNLTDDVGLPDQLIDPLLQFIGYRANVGINTEVTADAESNVLYMRFEQACDRARDLGVIPTDSYNMSVNTKGFI